MLVETCKRFPYDDHRRYLLFLCGALGIQEDVAQMISWRISRGDKGTVKFIVRLLVHSGNGRTLSRFLRILEPNLAGEFMTEEVIKLIIEEEVSKK